MFDLERLPPNLDELEKTARMPSYNSSLTKEQKAIVEFMRDRPRSTAPEWPPATVCETTHLRHPCHSLWIAVSVQDSEHDDDLLLYRKVHRVWESSAPGCLIPPRSS